MINFIVPGGSRTCYNQLLNTFINAIMQDDTNYTVSAQSIDGINVHFFLEPDVLNEVGLNGINVFLPHGIADKGYRNAESVNVFDYVIVSGMVWKEKLEQQGLSTDKIIVGGYPKMDTMFNMDRCKDKIVWLPTHNFSLYTSDKLSSFPDLLDYWTELTNHFNINVSTHPANKGNNKPTECEILEAKVVIADSGSTAYEAWALDIPVVFPDWIVKQGILTHHANTFEALIYEQSIDYHANSIDDLINCINSACSAGVTESARLFIDGIFEPTLRGKSGKSIYTALKLIQR